MLEARAIPALLLQDGGLVKTVKFKDPRYIGDPINAIRIFNEKEVDELMFLDIDASAAGREPDFDLIEDIASECFMPLCYGGGVTSIAQMRRIFRSGVEKISLGSTAVENPDLITEASRIFGKQSIVVTIDVKKPRFGSVRVHTLNGRNKTGHDPCDFARRVEAYGAGEIVINNIDRDGVMQGYDIELMTRITKAVAIPVIALGGCGNLQHMAEVVMEAHVQAAAAGSMFVFFGPLNGVLINYPEYSELRKYF